MEWQALRGDAGFEFVAVDGHRRSQVIVIDELEDPPPARSLRAWAADPHNTALRAEFRIDDRVVSAAAGRTRHAPAVSQCCLP